SHVDTTAIKTAREGGATAVLARSRFVSALPELILKYSRKLDPDGLHQACQEALVSLAVEGLELFNRHDYFEAHEILEEAWKADHTPGRELYRGVLQVAVAYMQIERGNYNGAAKMFLRMRQWLDPLPDICRGINVARLRADAYAAHEALLALGPKRVGEFDRGLLKPVYWTTGDGI
ncbi:MAG: DUF309 domain-containing protein, partial [Chloroflexota bacterium]